jgi:putative transposase
LDFYWSKTLNEASEIIGRWLAEYTSERLHKSLNHLMPEEHQLLAEKSRRLKSAWNSCAYTAGKL